MTENWFPTPIYYSYVSNVDAIQQDFEKVLGALKHEDSFKQVPQWQSHYLSDITFSKNLLDDYAVESFKAELDIHVRQYLLEIGSEIGKYQDMRYKVKSSWMTRNIKDSYAHIHSHGHSDMSGCYYVKTNGNDGDIFFETSNKLMNASYCYGHSMNRIKYKPEVGKIILFPGWLEHGVSANTTDNERISVSFNIDFERQF